MAELSRLRYGHCWRLVRPSIQWNSFCDEQHGPEADLRYGWNLLLEGRTRRAGFDDGHVRLSGDGYASRLSDQLACQLGGRKRGRTRFTRISICRYRRNSCLDGG